MDRSSVLFGPAPRKVTAVIAGLATRAVGVVPTVVVAADIAMTVSDWPVRARTDVLSDDPVQSMLMVLLMLLWNSAGLLLLTGRRAGRVLIMICSAAGLLYSSTGLGVAATENDLLAPMGIVFGALLLVSGVAGVCAAADDTGYWLEYRTASRIEKRSVPDRRFRPRIPTGK